MPRKCSICTHPKRAHINRTILSGKKSLRKIAIQYGIGFAAVQWHKKQHLIAAMKLAKKNGEIEQGRSGYEQYNFMLKEVEKKYGESEGMLQVTWFREWRGMLKMAFDMGMEEERRRERQVFQDVTPAVLLMIEAAQKIGGNGR